MIKVTERNITEKCNLGAKELEFAVFCVENVAAELGISGNTVY